MLGNLASSLFTENGILPGIFGSFSSSTVALRHGAAAAIPIVLTVLKTFLTCSSVVILTYMALVRKRRYQAINRMLKKYPDPTLPLRNLEVAYEVWSLTSHYEFPFMVEFSVPIFNLRVAGIPTASRVFASTKQMSDHGVKRIEDTTLLLSEALQGYSRRQARSMLVDEVDPATGKITTKPRKPKLTETTLDDEELKERANDDARANAAVERINFFHSHYNIAQEEFLYTLGLFVIEPIYLVNKYEWRPFTVLEENAMLAVWTDLGRKMGIENIPKTVRDFEDWVEDYESRKMKYAPVNNKMADCSIAVSQALVTTPEAKARVKKFLIALMSQRNRAAVGYPEPSKIQIFLSKSVLWVHGYIVKYLMMPRTAPRLVTALRATKFEDVDVEKVQADGKINGNVELAGGCPFSGGMRYVPRFHDQGPIYPRGYKIEELGPTSFFGKGPHVCPVSGLNVAPVV
ncbi:hypothetical protein BGX27_001062 [Mortierella sp. AM989]|nr:hypothetical protein BGX27_001062 [Mortierella sp. AM989]